MSNKNTKVARDVVADLIGGLPDKSKGNLKKIMNGEKPVAKKAVKAAKGDAVRRSKFKDTAKITITAKGKERGTRDGSNCGKIMKAMKTGMTVAQYRTTRGKIKGLPKGTGMPFLSYLAREGFVRIA